VEYGLERGLGFGDIAWMEWNEDENLLRYIWWHTLPGQNKKLWIVLYYEKKC